MPGRHGFNPRPLKWPLWKVGLLAMAVMGAMLGLALWLVCPPPCH